MTTALLFSLLAVFLGGVLTYLFDRQRERRAAAADALVTSMAVSQRARFLWDLSMPAHRQIVVDVLEPWAEALALETGGDPTPEDRARKFDEILGWRIDEREARIRFAVTARNRDLHQLATYFSLLKSQRGEVSPRGVTPEFSRQAEQLIDTIERLRRPALLPGWSPVGHGQHSRRHLARREDIRVLALDYSGDDPIIGGA